MSRDEIINMARESGLVSASYVYDSTDEADWKDIERFASLVAAAEREACAQLCDKQHDRARTSTGAARADACAAAIRARGAA